MQGLKKRDLSNAFKNFLLLFASITTVLFLAEVATRVFNLDGDNIQDRFLNPHDRFFFNIPINEKDPYLFWRLKSSASFGKIHTNSERFRGKEISKEKKAGKFRIITLGDSCTLGVGVAERETYASILEGLLNKNAMPSENYEVINAGVAGYSSLQGLRYLKTKLIKYKPDIITVQFGFNDYLYTGGPSDKDIPESSRLAIYIDDVMRNSRFYRFIDKRISSLTSKGTVYPPNRRVDIVDFKKNLKEIISIANKSGAKVLLLNLPVRFEIPLVVNAIPIAKNGKDGGSVEWLRPAVIENKNYYVQSDFDGPITVLEKAVKDYPQWALAHYFLARKYESNGEIEKADKEFKKAKETDVDRKVIAEYNKAISEIGQEINSPIVDLVSLFESRKEDGLFLDERHTSALAHSIIAKEVYNSLKTNNLIE